MRLPVLLSIPHGGTMVPPEVLRVARIQEREIMRDGDAYTIQLYDLGDGVRAVVRAEAARAFVDMNRSIRDVPPSHPDGMIKSATCYGVPIYEAQPDHALRDALVRNYYLPYHRAIQRGLREDIQLCMDCHSMASVPPPVSPDAGSGTRPLFCLSNRRGRTCTDQTMERLAGCISESYGIDASDIRFNDPFLGGHITGTYGNNPLPWVQVEMNRSMYLPEGWPDEVPDERRLRALREMFADTLRMYFEA